jgi:hypothetical protein
MYSLKCDIWIDAETAEAAYDKLTELMLEKAWPSEVREICKVNDLGEYGPPIWGKK